MDHQLKIKRSKLKSAWFALGRLSAFLIFNFFFLSVSAQHYTRVDTIPVKINGNFLKMPWVGGHNFVQFSDIDMNFDGIKDLFVFDRTGHKITTYINHGTPNTVDYTHEPQYESKFPHLEDWVLIRDYNGDGLPDIFTYAISVGGIKVWKNTSSGGNLQFTLQTLYLKSNYGSSPPSNLYVSRVDIPTIDDIDGDGDLDIVTMDGSSATTLEYHVNKSKELGYGCDSLIFALDPSGCWGHVQEDLNNCNVYLSSCKRTYTDTTDHAHPFASPPRGAEYPAPKDDENSQLPVAPLDRHSGNCSVCIDMDGDKDKEVLL